MVTMLTGLMFHRVDWKRPVLSKDDTNTEYRSGEALKKRAMKCHVQPVAAGEEVDEQGVRKRTMKVTHQVFTTHLGDFQRNDRLYFGSRKLYVTGARNLVEMDRVVVLDCVEYNGADFWE